MIRTLRVVTLLLLIVVPAASWGAALDDYYLSRLANAHSGARSLAAIVPGQSLGPDRGQTIIRHQAWLDWQKLQPSTRKTLAKVMARPTLAGERTCTPVGGHFTIHYATSGSDAPDSTDANGNNVPDWVETVAGVFEYVYSVEIGKMGYQAPPGSSYDVYLEDLAPQKVYGFTTNDFTGVTSVSYPSYIEIDKSFTNSIFLPFAPITSLRITAAHEFHHAIQYGYNAYFPSVYAEMTSTWMEDEVYDSGNQLYDYIPDYLSYSDTIAINGPMDNSNSPYGRWVFNRYLAELQGRTVVRSIWEKLGSMPAPSSAAPDSSNEIPIEPIIDSVLKGNFANNFFGFAKRMLVRDWSSHQSELSLIPRITPLAVNSVHGTVTPTLSLPTAYTFGYYRYTASTQDGQPLLINLPSLPAALAVTAFQVDGSTATGWQEYPYDSGNQRITIPVFNNDVYLVVCNNGGNMAAPVVVSPAFPADSSTILDGTNLDANVLTIPQAQPVPTGSKSSGGGCFIATAAYGSYLHPKVAELRQFRDRYLMTNAPGRAFVAAYYAVSPPIAKVIAGHEWMRAAVRVLLTPLVFAVEHPWLALIFVLALAGGVGWRWVSRREKRTAGASASVVG
ncbi:MXAN_6640 family putative metalloprotease [Geomesophilobacter sediminis]|uniref:Uncharacterized protein n=1 Tax=Geomesophilobacter sediminis TaxID=2798584 RepID=A0A8J7J9T8_9BACT|nr:MXAN_6640 family putative metalloprotease [Geomesophilobacter sediminis]MBJ6723486.1 hypothetical protein [Geomesophilobacter sediminis]